ncbi:MAG TPA: hypothetical protein VH394_08780 [Thermoanaerobaculia bacterium]|nr:hypothetical protein [Thermoanaerobaculia bacterium]
MTDPKQRKAALLASAMMLLIAVPATITLWQVKVAGTLKIPSSNPTPFGYTWSLLLFVVPGAVLGLWLVRRRDLVDQRRAALWAAPFLIAQGFALDLFFGARFFIFPNRGATLGWDVPVVGGHVPVEEFVFYAGGFLVVLLFYLWNDELWCSRYNDQNYSVGLQRSRRLLRFHKESFAVAIVMIAAAWLYKNTAGEPGWPAYFIFLVLVALVPSIGFFAAVRPYVNWRAVSVTFFALLLVSLLWEATLAVPYGWWGYRMDAMAGLTVDAWAHLPVEAVLVWFAVTYSTVIWYEVFKIWQASKQPAKVAFLNRGGRATRVGSPLVD